jgi:hypothetical protein
MRETFFLLFYFLKNIRWFQRTIFYRCKQFQARPHVEICRRIADFIAKIVFKKI